MTEAFNKFKRLLDELFQFDRADLDFGIYRIMNSKRDEVSDFLEHELLPQVRKAFEKYRAGDEEHKRERMAEIERNAAAFSADPEQNDEYRQLKADLAESKSVAALEDEVYSDLYTFFRRYYKNGDFLSLRRYKADTYAIPYEGEEVKLHWANADQYYVKTTESFRDYRFRLPDGRHVHFRLAAASTERDNNKAQNSKDQRFVLREETPVEETNGELNVYFEYRPHADKQKTLNERALAAVFDDAALDGWEDALRTPMPTQSNLGRTTVEKYLGDYTAKNSFDYFIHKDLGRFLRRELDFYLKNEVLHVDDLDAENADRAVQYLSKLGVVKQIGHKIIAFLAQLEDFQKKLFEKKKFVVQSGYCLTLNHVPEDLYAEILANDAQYAEWERLFAISEIPANLENGGEDQRSEVWLKANLYLVLDTKFFGSGFKNRLLANIDDLDERTDGLLVNSENLQALNLLQERYRERVRFIYIDPPYNTGDDGFLYKDNFRHSSWLSMINDRLAKAGAFNDELGTIAVSIDDAEVGRLTESLDRNYGPKNELVKSVWDRNRKNDAKFFSVGHEYMLVYAKNKDLLEQKKVRFREPKEGFEDAQAVFARLLNEHGEDWEKVRSGWMAFFDDIPVSDPRRRLMRYSKVGPRGPYRDDGDASWPGGGGPRYEVLHPVTKKPVKIPSRGWVYAKPERFWERYEEGRVVFGPDETTVPSIASYLFDSSTQVMPSVFYSYAQTAAQEFNHLFEEEGVFDNPKNWRDILRLVRYLSTDTDTTLDFFAGSGTTGHAVVNLNREDGGKRKYILAEMGEYFDTVLKPRIQKVVYSKDWKDGKPVSREGSSHIFKYLKLESYEDALNNVALSRKAPQQEIVESDAAVREEYMLSYMLDDEASGSPSLLNSEAFEKPFSYKLKVTDGSETRSVDVDMAETFNYLLGLTVERVGFEDGFRTVEGRNPQGKRVLVIWRNLGEQTNIDLDEFFAKQGYGSRQEEEAFDLIYVNGDDNLENLKDKGARWRTLLIEEEFRRSMFGSGGDLDSFVGAS